MRGRRTSKTTTGTKGGTDTCDRRGSQINIRVRRRRLQAAKSPDRVCILVQFCCPCLQDSQTKQSLKADISEGFRYLALCVCVCVSVAFSSPMNRSSCGSRLLLNVLLHPLSLRRVCVDVFSLPLRRPPVNSTDGRRDRSSLRRFFVCLAPHEAHVSLRPWISSHGESHPSPCCLPCD